LKKLLFIILFALIAYLSYSQQASNVGWENNDFESRPKIGLALSGGAAHGLAHIGVLRFMEEIGIEVDYITGTSMGAIVGGLYAIGNDAEQCYEIASDIDWQDVLSNQVSLTDIAPIEKANHNKYPLSFTIKNGEFVIPKGILPRTKLDLLIEELFASAYHIKDFNELPTPFACCAVDIVKGEVITMKEGKLTEAIRASMAIPSVFKPVLVEDKLLVDGNIDELESLVDLLKQSAFMMSLSDTDRQMSLTDILVLPDVKDEPVFSFDKFESLIDKGYEAAQVHEAEFLKLKELLDHFDSPPTKMVIEKPGFIFINEVIVDGVGPFAQRIIIEKMKLKDRSFTTFAKINDGIKAIYATKNFKDVTYNLNPSRDGNNLLITTKELQATKIGVNLNHFSSTKSAIIAQLEARNYLGKQSLLDMKLRLGSNVGFSTRYYKRSTVLKDGLIFGFDGKVEKYEIAFFNKSVLTKNMSQWDLIASPYAMWEPNNSMHLKVDWKARYLALSNNIFSEDDIISSNAKLFSLGVSFGLNTINKTSFANNGIGLNVGAEWVYSGNMKSETNGEVPQNFRPEPEPYLLAKFSLKTYTPLSSKFTIFSRVEGRFMTSDFFMANTFIGGTDQNRNDRIPFIGMKESQLHMSTLGYGRLGIRWHVWSIIYASALANVIVGDSPTLPYSTNSDNTRIASNVGVGMSIGLDLPVGPFNVDVGYLLNDKTNAYFGLGYRHIL